MPYGVMLLMTCHFQELWGEITKKAIKCCPKLHQILSRPLSLVNRKFMDHMPPVRVTEIP